MKWTTGFGISPLLGKKSSSWSSYWAIRYISGLSVETTSSTEQTVIATIVGTGYDGVSFEYSTDLGATWSAGITDADGILNKTGLTEGTLYIWRARLYKGINYGGYSDWDAGFTTEIINDADGNVYTTVTIGTQIWILQNLKTTKYNDASAIPTGLSDANWALEDGTGGHDGAFAQVNNDAGNKTAYGLLYNWHAVNNAKGIAPSGFRIATDADYDTLVAYLDGTTFAGWHMKEIGTTRWNSPNPLDRSDNSSGFTAVGAGYKAADGSYGLLKDYALLWTSTEALATTANDVQIDRTALVCDQVTQAKTLGLSVRCIENRLRFKDGYTNDILAPETAYGESCVLLNDAGTRIDMWCFVTDRIKYSYSTDGINFSVPVATDIPLNYKRTCMMKIGSTYYNYSNNAADTSKHLFTSTNMINFTDQGEVIGLGGVGDWDEDAIGNSFVWREGTNYFMIYEGIVSGRYWGMGLATASAPEGPWTKYASNPTLFDVTKDLQGCTLPRVDNEVIKHNGKYYIFYSSGDGGHTGVLPELNRAYSTDLYTWTQEGYLTDVLHKVVGYTAYGDPALVQFGGKSYIFINPSNQVDSAYFDVSMDNRPLIAMLALTP